MTEEEKDPAPAEVSEEAAPPAEDEALQKAVEEAQTLKDQLLRAMAETENTRRRMQKEVADAQRFGIAAFAKDMLAVADNFSRAMESAPKEGGEAVKNFLEGVAAIERQILAAFEKFGIKKLDPLGQPFDPHLHRVMLEQEDLSKPAGTIIQVFQPGYMIHDRLLREAQVVVTKGGPPAHKVDTQA